MKVGGIKAWKELTTGVQQSVKVAFNNGKRWIKDYEKPSKIQGDKTFTNEGA